MDNNMNYNAQSNMNKDQMPQNNEKKKKTNKGLKIVAFILAAAVLIGGSAATGAYIGSHFNQNTEITADADTKNSTEDESKKVKATITAATVSGSATTADVSQVVQNVMPSIVAITNIADEQVTDVFGQTSTQETGGKGSGIIIGQNDDEILIVTNNHVVSTDSNAENQKLTVTFGDDTSAEATIKGTEAGSDLAVIAVKTEDIKSETMNYIKIATLGDSDSLKVGEMAIAIGNALGYGQSVTVGYISALNREVATEDYTMKLIQTDAAINPGNSGGALINSKGEVVGINSAKYSDTSVEGMGFSIPVSTAIPIVNDLMNREVIPEDEQSYLGIIGTDVTEEYNTVYNIPLGVYVSRVSEKSPAAAAGIKMGDVITEFNGTAIKSMSALQSKLAGVRAGTVVKLKVMKYFSGSYKETEVQVTLGNKSEAEAKSSQNNNNSNGSRRYNNSQNGNGDYYYSPFGNFFNNFNQ